MLNPDLQRDIDIEIQKAEPNIQDFLHDKYFRETIDLIIKVNKLSDEQGEAVELETVLTILGISDHATIEDSITGECYIEDRAVADQVVIDLKKFIFSKINPLKEIKVTTESEPNTKPLRNVIYDAYGGEVLAPPVLDYYEEVRTKSKQIPMISDDSTVKKITITEPAVMHDAYREVPNAADEGLEEDNYVKSNII